MSRLVKTRRPRTYAKGKPCRVLVASTEKRFVVLLTQLRSVSNQ